MKALHHPGIYAIINNKNHKLYIGQTLNLNSRKRSHFYRLNHNTHNNPSLQASFNKHSPKTFSFIILTMCHPDKLNEYEELFINLYHATNPRKGYNIKPGGANEHLHRTRATRLKQQRSLSKFYAKYRPDTPPTKDAPDRPDSP